VDVNGRRVGSDGPRTRKIANVIEGDLCGGWEMSTCERGGGGHVVRCLELGFEEFGE
jgi:hypothetical protein